VGIDFFEPYLRQSKQRGIHDDLVLADITKLNFRPKCVDAVVALDVIEHLVKRDALQLIKRMQSWSKKKVIILVPNGFIPQDACNGNPLQVHKSGWTAEEMTNLGFKVRG
jgi:cyclopropane fatty-acyl-phospholipid synthase-like methyltransferase